MVVAEVDHRAIVGFNRLMTMLLLRLVLYFIIAEVDYIVDNVAVAEVYNVSVAKVDDVVIVIANLTWV